MEEEIRRSEASKHALKRRTTRFFNLERQIKSLVKVAVTRTVSRGRKAGVPCELTWRDLRIPTRCPVFDTELDWFAADRNRNSPELDRLNPARGYVQGNVGIISARANKLKGNATTIELIQLANYMTRQEGLDVVFGAM